MNHDEHIHSQIEDILPDGELCDRCYRNPCKCEDYNRGTDQLLEDEVFND